MAVIFPGFSQADELLLKLLFPFAELFLLVWIVFRKESFDVTLHIILRHYAYFFIPNYPSDIATVNFDRTGTTKIRKWYFNQSFMVPGLIGVTMACLTGLGLARIFI